LIDVHPEDQLKTLMAILYFFSEEPVKNDEQQDCCLIVEVHAPDWIKDELIQLAAEEAIEDAFGRRLTLWSADEDEAYPRLLRIRGRRSVVLAPAADRLNPMRRVIPPSAETRESVWRFLGRFAQD
jgi:hypothetical protein